MPYWIQHHITAKHCVNAAVGGATSGAVIGALDVPAGFGNNTAATVVEVPSTIEQVWQRQQSVVTFQ